MRESVQPRLAGSYRRWSLIIGLGRAQRLTSSTASCSSMPKRPGLAFLGLCLGLGFGLYVIARKLIGRAAINGRQLGGSTLRPEETGTERPSARAPAPRKWRSRNWPLSDCRQTPKRCGGRFRILTPSDPVGAGSRALARATRQGEKGRLTGTAGGLAPYTLPPSARTTPRSLHSNCSPSTKPLLPGERATRGSRIGAGAPNWKVRLRIAGSGSGWPPRNGPDARPLRVVGPGGARSVRIRPRRDARIRQVTLPPADSGTEERDERTAHRPSRN